MCTGGTYNNGICDLKAAVRVFVSDLDADMTSLRERLLATEENIKFLSDEQLQLKKTVDDAFKTRIHVLEVRMSSRTVKRIRDRGQAINMVKYTEEKLMKFMEDKMKELHEELGKPKVQIPPKVVPREQILGELMSSSKVMRETLEERMEQRAPMTAKERKVLRSDNAR
jgi:predicted  nucleic acid-binding Zn-ribbon protein